MRIFGRTALTPMGDRWAAVLAAGDDTAFTRDTGAALTGLATAGRRLHLDDDRRRDQQALAAGHVVFRVTWRHATVEWTAVAADLLDLLARRTPGSAGRSCGEVAQAA